MSARPSVLIVEDHVLLAESLAVALRLRDFDEVDVVDVAGLDDAAILARVEGAAPDVVLVDLHLGDDRLSLPLIAPIIERGPVVLVLTASADRVLLARCLEAGAVGVFGKAQAFDDLATGLVDAMLGRATMHPAARDELLAELDEHRRRADHLDRLFAQLTERERDVFAAIIDGRNADEIAARQFVSVATVRSHIRSILEKLGVNSQLAAVALARRTGWPDRHSA
jgi:two-component system nitrate/nitrite response regulator NarL